MKRLSSIAPVWAQRIKDKTITKHMRELGSFSKCVVGEAWHYTSEYMHICETCRDHSLELTVGEDGKARFSEFKKKVNKFIEHFEKEHLVN